MFRNVIDLQALFILGGAALVAAALPTDDAEAGASAGENAVRNDLQLANSEGADRGATGSLNFLQSGTAS